jgi:phosphoketolase
MISPNTVPETLRLLDAYWRAANYLAVGQIYLLDNPLLAEPLRPAHIKPRLLGHWGTTPGQNFIYAHLNRLITALDLDMIYLSGPGHGGPAVVANVYLEGTYSEVYPAITQDRAGLAALFRQFSFPGGIPSHVAPETPGSIHEGGELGYSLSHAFGAVFDNPDLIAACVIGDGEAETGPLATAWHSNMFLNPATDGAVLPILHLNGYKIANPTVLARMPRTQLAELLRGYGWNPHFVEGHDPAQMHVEMARTLDIVVRSIRDFQTGARTAGDRRRAPDRRDISRPPDSVDRTAHQSRSPATARGLDAQLPARRAVRRRGPSPSGDRGARAGGAAADGGQSSRERRTAPARSGDAGFQDVRRPRRRSRRDRRRGHTRARRLAAGRRESQRGAAQLPAVRSG